MQETQETWVQSLSQKDPPEKEMATHSSILAWEILWTEESGRATVYGVGESDTIENASMCSRLQILLRRGEKTSKLIPSTWWVPPRSHRGHLWIPVLLVLTFCWPDKYSCISSLLVVLFFVPELSPREDQCLIPSEIFSTGQQIPSSDPDRSHSLWYWSGWSDEKMSLMLFDATFLHQPQSWSPALRTMEAGGRRTVLFI